MRKVWIFIPLILVLLSLISGCDSAGPTSLQPLDTADTSPVLASPSPYDAPAVVYEDYVEYGCRAFGYEAERPVKVRWSSDPSTLHLICRFRDLPPIPRTEKTSGFMCRLSSEGGGGWSYDSRYVRTKNGNAKLWCTIKMSWGD